jgi:NTP pyrophosphatase (non-canonical NTP hydrolase)
MQAPEPPVAATRLTFMELAAFQETLRDTYLARDRARGTDATFRWFTEEVGELARAIRTGERANLKLEVSDVLAWLASLANLLDVDLDEVATRYADGCPKCHASPCVCPM